MRRTGLPPPISMALSSGHLPRLCYCRLRRCCRGLRCDALSRRRALSSSSAARRPPCLLEGGGGGMNGHKNKYADNPTRYWEQFYKRHNNKFFKDRHYLEKDWGSYFSSFGEADDVSTEPKVVLEVGCGAGNTLFPLLATFPNIFVHACDFSSHAISLVKANEAFTPERVNAFVCDVTLDDLGKKILPSSVDVITLIFMLSAVSPTKMSIVLQNIINVLKPHGYVLFRDYAIGDFAQEKLACKNQIISENFYVRGDGTCAFYFSEDSLSRLFEKNGFSTVEVSVYCKEIQNRSRKVVMDRRWMRAIFCSLGDHDSHQTQLHMMP